MKGKTLKDSARQEFSAALDAYRQALRTKKNRVIAAVRVHAASGAEGVPKSWRSAIGRATRSGGLALLTFAASAVAQTPTETVAAVLVAEAGGDGVAAMRAVREVVQMRAWQQQRAELAIVTAPKQFSCLNRIQPARLVAISKRHTLWPDAVRLAASPVRQATVWQANHYHATTVRPAWAAGRTPVAKVGGHVFYRL